MTGRPRRPAAPSGREEHLAWLSLTEVTGPFLTVPVLTRIWPTLEAGDKPTRDALAVAHASAAADPDGWIDWVLSGLLGWGDTMDTAPGVSLTVAEHDAMLTASFAVRDPTSNTPVLLGMTTPAGQHPAGRVRDETWAASPIDRMAMLCRAEGVELGLVTDGRWWALVWAPRGKVTTSAVFDSVTWPESADRIVVRAFTSLLQRRRFFGVPDDQRLPALLAESVDNQEEITEQLGVQVRQAVELLVQAIGRDEQRAIEAGGTGLDQVSAEEVYAGTVTVMMRIVFLLYAEERGLLPADNDLYAAAYSAARLGEQLQARADEAGEETLQNSYTGWYRLLALFAAVHAGIDHPLLTLHAYDGSIFDPDPHAWLADVRVDDQAVLHMLAAVQRVSIKGETRRLSFRSLDVEQIGYVYEGLLSFNGYRAGDVVLGLTGRLGAEEEVHLSDLETLHDSTRDDDEFAETLATIYKSSGIGSPRAITKRLGDPDGAARSAAEGILAAVTANDPNLIGRLLPFYRLIRTDLRGLPMVIRPGALYVTQSSLRASTGTHYTPRFLAEQVVAGALEPLLYSPGPLQTADKTQWQPRTSAQILALKVADIAMGSGAFLVAACRYLGAALVEAWAREGDPRAAAAALRSGETAGVIDTEVDPVVTEARRQVIEHCLYGVDINPKAVEMAKLSLWLVSMDPKRPFTFLDDRLVTGDSLLGITSLDQLETMHLDPVRGRKLHQGGLIDLTAGIRDRVRQAAKDRAELAGMPGETLSELAAKRSQLAAVQEGMSLISRYADLLAAASLAEAGRGVAGLDLASNKALTDIRRITTGEHGAGEHAKTDLREWLDTDRPDGGFPLTTFHWPLVFPEVFDAGGFDTIIGNPPFLGGQKLTGTYGTAYRNYLVQAIGNGIRGSADLVAYFVLRAHALLNPSGQTGLIATNTLAQGDTRVVGLDQIVASDTEIRQAIKSEPWPSKSAVLQYCAIWTTKKPMAQDAQRRLDGLSVPGITSALDRRSRATGIAERLDANAGIAFQGSIILGLGFTLEPKRARELMTADPRNREVLFPYIIGQDLNNRSDCSASRWVINFHDWTQERAASYGEPFNQVERRVKPERLANRDTGARRYWWRFLRPRPEMQAAVGDLGRVIAITLHAKAVMPAMVSAEQVFSHALGIFATDDTAMLALLSSAPHYWWAIAQSTIKGDLRYTPTDVFETVARPELTDEMRSLGIRLDTFRRALMLSRQAGLTTTYNLVHDPACANGDIVQLREIHRLIDEAVCRAYGWDGLLASGLDHGFHDTRQGIRYTVGPVVRQEILDRLLELNHERYAAEQRSGAGGKRKTAQRPEQPELFG